MPLRHFVSSQTSPRVTSDSRFEFPSWSSRPSETNRNATIVASKRGRARLGLLERIFRRDLSLRVVDLEVEAMFRSGIVARCHNVRGDVVCLVVEEVVDVEEFEPGGRVTSQIIVVNS